MTAQQHNKRLLIFREAQDVLKARKRIVIVELKNGSRQTLERAFCRGKEQQMIVSTLAGLSDQWSSFYYFDNLREAQDFLLKTDTAKAA